MSGRSMLQVNLVGHPFLIAFFFEGASLSNSLIWTWPSFPFLSQDPSPLTLCLITCNLAGTMGQYLLYHAHPFRV